MRSSIDMKRRIVPVAVLVLLVALPACVSPEKKLSVQKRSDTHLALARKLMEEQRYPEALGQVNLAINDTKKNPDAYMTRGQIEFMRAEYAPAIEDFTSAMRYRDSFTEARSWRAWAYIESGDLKAGETDYREGLKDRTYITPEKLHLNLALLLYRTGRDAEGLSELRQAVEVNPGYARGNFELGKALEKNGDLKGALTYYQAALGGMKDSADLNLRYALALEKSGEGSRAREHFKRVIELSPDGPEALTARDHLKALEASS